MIYLLQQMKDCFRSEYSFVPRSFLLPDQHWTFLKVQRGKKYIIKPDDGALGVGIEIVLPGSPAPHWSRRLAIAQEYLESKQFNGFKFDLRVYAVVTSVEPLEVYVYRDGIVRVCAERYGGPSQFSQLTNTAVNKKRPGVRIEDITRRIREVFPRLEGANVEDLWARIDRVVLLTIVAAVGFMRQGVNRMRLNQRGVKCFQLFGFDILLDEALGAHLLEVNYRPSLASDSAEELALKKQMLIDLSHLVLGGDEGEAEVSEWRQRWGEFFDSNPRSGDFHKVECEDDPQLMEKLLAVSLSIPSRRVSCRGLDLPTPQFITQPLRSPVLPRAAPQPKPLPLSVISARRTRPVKPIPSSTERPRTPRLISPRPISRRQHPRWC
jgi:hypothetical protein